MDSLSGKLRKAIDTVLAWPGRPVDSSGRPGAFLELPGCDRAMIVGDLHASLSNLDLILANSNILDGLASGQARLAFLGDLVHDDRPGHLDEMANSIDMLGRACDLLTAFPGRILWLRGNHDSFDPPLTKGWVHQGRLFREAVEEYGGARLVGEVQALFDALPLVALGDSFILAHAGPPQGGMSREALIEARPGSSLARELVWNRISSRPGESGSYCEEDVRVSVAALGLPPGSAFIVGHNPLWSRGDESGLWSGVGGIPGHYILYSGALGQAPWLEIREGSVSAHFARRRAQN